MYLFYFDESGSRDPSVGTPEKPKDHIYVLLAVGFWEGQWRKFDREITIIKRELADSLKKQGKGTFDLADCEIKSNWLRSTREHSGSVFLDALDNEGRTKISETYYDQLGVRNSVIFAAVIDKRGLHSHFDGKRMHEKCYEFLLERIQLYMKRFHSKHNALFIMDDTGKKTNRGVAMKHASFLLSGNMNMNFKQIIEYPFFTASELSNGVQLADLLAYNVYRVFKGENFDYPYFQRMLPYFDRYDDDKILSGLKIWPGESPLNDLAKSFWIAEKQHYPRPPIKGGRDKLHT